MDYHDCGGPPLSREEEFTLGARVAAGDRAAAERMFAAVLPLAMRMWAEGTIRRVSDADDILQEMLLRLWRYLPHYDPQRGRLSTYAHKVLRTALWNAILVRRRRCSRTRPLRRAIVSHQESDLEKFDSIGRVLEAMRQMPEEQQGLLRARFWEDKTFAEMADGVAWQVVQRKVRSAVQRLQAAVCDDT